MNVLAMSVALLSTRAMPRSPSFTVPSFMRNTFCVYEHEQQQESMGKCHVISRHKHILTRQTIVTKPNTFHYVQIQWKQEKHKEKKGTEKKRKENRIDKRESGRKEKEKAKASGRTHLKVAVEHSLLVHILRTQEYI